MFFSGRETSQDRGKAERSKEHGNVFTHYLKKEDREQAMKEKYCSFGAGTGN
jgi:hypothetical protein